MGVTTEALVADLVGRTGLHDVTDVVAGLSSALASEVCSAAGAIGPRSGVTVGRAGGRVVVRISTRPGAIPAPTSVDLATLADELAEADDPTWSGCRELVVDGADRLIHGADAQGFLDRLSDGQTRRALVGGIVRSAAEPVRLGNRRQLILAGGAVQRAGLGPRLCDAARRAGVGVVNTVSAKGLLVWDDPLHHGTVGLQADDFVLAGFDDVDEVIGFGVDPAEAPRYRWTTSDVTVRDLPASAVERIEVVADGDVPPKPPLFERLADALVDHYAGRVPGSPVNDVMALAERAVGGAVVVAGPGRAGLWVARTFPTRQVGSVVVPATGDAAFAPAAALASAHRGRPAVAVVDSEPDPEIRSVVEAVGGSIEVWDHDPAHLDALTAVAGPVVAWT